MDKIVVSLDYQALTEVNEILMDDDKEKALDFIKKHIEPALHHKEHGGMLDAFQVKEKGQRLK